MRSHSLGEEALIHLESFTLAGKQNTNLRTVKNRLEREGFRFEIAQPPHDQLLVERLAYISNEWLDGKHEKGYSLGWFEADYLQTAPVALLKNTGGDIIAFAH